MRQSKTYSEYMQCLDRLEKLLEGGVVKPTQRLQRQMIELWAQLSDSERKGLRLPWRDQAGGAAGAPSAAQRETPADSRTGRESYADGIQMFRPRRAR